MKRIEATTVLLVVFWDRFAKARPVEDAPACADDTMFRAARRSVGRYLQACWLRRVWTKPGHISGPAAGRLCALRGGEPPP